MIVGHSGEGTVPVSSYYKCNFAGRFVLELDNQGLVAQILSSQFTDLPYNDSTGMNSSADGLACCNQGRCSYPSESREEFDRKRRRQALPVYANMVYTLS